MEKPSGTLNSNKIKIATNIISIFKRKKQKIPENVENTTISHQEFSFPTKTNIAKLQQNPNDYFEKPEPSDINQIMCDQLEHYLEDLNAINSDIKKLRSTRILNVNDMLIKTTQQTENNKGRARSSSRGRALREYSSTRALDSLRNHLKKNFGLPPIDKSEITQIATYGGLPKIFSVRKLHDAVFKENVNNESARKTASNYFKSTRGSVPGNILTRPVSKSNKRAISVAKLRKVVNSIKK